MKRINLFQVATLLLCVAIIVLVYATNAGKPSDNAQQAVIDNIFARRSVRSYLPNRPVGRDTLQLLAKVGMAAPSGKNVQPWAFVAVTERATLDSLAAKLPYAKMLKDAPAAMIVCGDTSKDSKELWVLDCSAATQNILLTAEALGLGAVWTAAYPYVDRMATVAQVLGLPANIIPLCVVPIGYPDPDGSELPKDKWRSENLKWEKWQ
ncbi:MAG: nitroreductase family protein [Prevotellaceae bacterium]|jgi:nitroreductase|nr:nitroreductase family protein [Prevotellaceae bacterium]